MRILPLAAGALLAALALAAPAAGQGTAVPDTVRGRVIGADSVPVAQAEVSVRSGRTSLLRTTLTDAAGRWQVVFPERAEAYEVSVRRIGQQSRRVRAARTGPGAVQAPLVVLADQAVVLEGITVSGERPVPVLSAPGGDRLPHERSAAQTWDPGDQTRLSRGELHAVGALAPGATVLEDGSVSVGGLGAGQNSFRINGLRFGGGRIPELAGLHGYATTQSADASRGGFSGGEVTVGLMSGHYQDTYLALRLFSSEPSLQWTGGGDGLARRYRDLRLSSAFLTAMLDQRASLSVAVDAQRRTTPVLSALSGDDVLRSAGVAPDSLARLGQILGGFGVPVSAGGVPREQAWEQVNVLANLGLHRWFWDVEGSVHLQLDRSDRTPVGLSATVLPAAGGRTRQDGMNAGAQVQRLASNGFLHEAGIVWDRRTASSASYLGLPGGVVRLVSEPAPGERAVSSLRFGGRGGVSEGRSSFVDGRYQVRWKTFDERHQRTLGVEGTTEGRRELAESDPLGTWTFASLADVQAGRPSSFSRSLGAEPRSARFLSGAVYADNLFRPSEQVEVRAGVRVEAARYGAPGSRDAAAEAAFGARGVLPAEVAIVPRLGFSWRAPRGLAGRGRAPFGSLSGALSLDRDRLDPAGELGRGASGFGERVLRCVGDAVPAPDWAAHADDAGTIPAACLGGGAGEPDADAGAPWVTLYDAGYRAPRAWKASLSWSGRIPGPSPTPGGLRLTVDALHVRGVLQPGAVDANLARDPRFVLADEGRPVFAPAAAIIAATGEVGLDASRRTDSFGRADLWDSRGATRTWTLAVTLAPARTDHSRPRYGLTGSWSRGRARMRHPDEPTTGDPRALEWRRNPYVAEYAVRGFVLFPLLRGERNASLRITGRAQSGLPYTPLASGDVNGDGNPSNDAAFVFDPARAQDPAVAEGMRALLDGADGDARHCLERSLGRVATPMSCTGPWTLSMDAELVMEVPTPAGRGAAVTVRARNLPGALDQLLHGSRGRRGWGDPAWMDRTLLSVRGFDPAGERFLYDVNGRFGFAAGRARTPFVLEIVANVTVGRSDPTVAVSELAHRLRREALTAADSLNEMAGHLLSPTNPAGILLRDLADALLLTGGQMRALETMEREFDDAAAALMADALSYLRTSIGHRSSSEVARALAPHHERYEALHLAYLACVRRVLAPDQWLLIGAEWDAELRAHRPRPDDPRPACLDRSAAGEADTDGVR